MSKPIAKSFIDQFVALVTGDDSKVKAEKTLRQAQAALQSHISSFEGDKIDLEEKVNTAEEKLAAARLNNGKLITDRFKYIENLVAAANAVEEAKEELKAHVDLLEFLTLELESIQ